MQSCVYDIERPHAKGVLKSGARCFSRHKLSKHRLFNHRSSKQSEASINLLAGFGVELARPGVGGDAHCGVLVRG
jgi:hypothetical protein